jgi:hypothetical protein
MPPFDDDNRDAPFDAKPKGRTNALPTDAPGTAELLAWGFRAIDPAEYPPEVLARLKALSVADDQVWAREQAERERNRN